MGRGNGEGLLHASHFIDRASAEQALELSAELGRAFIADLAAGAGCGHLITKHEQPRVMQARRLQVLHRGCVCDSLEMRVERRDTHTSFVCHPCNIQISAKRGMNAS